MLRSLLGRVRGVVTKKTRGRRMKAHYVAQQAEGLKGRPGIWMNLGRRHVERSKNAHRKRVKRQRHVEVRKETSVHIKERGTVSRSPHTHSLSWPTRHNIEITRVVARLQNWVLNKEIGHALRSTICGRFLNHVRIHPAKIH